MPCFDKKLEASRSDFYNDLYSTRDVDCVITSGKLWVGFVISVKVVMETPNSLPNKPIFNLFPNNKF